MGSQENFALRWNDFHSNIETLFKHLRSASEFQDVTLVCGLEEGEIKAHKVILSSCSGYFQSILSRTNAPHPVIVMPKDVHLDDISGIVDFMYYGEVAVPTADISRFLAVAEQFQVRGLVEDVPKLGAVSSSRYQSKRPRMTKEDEHEEDDHYEEEDLHQDEDEVMAEGKRYRSPAPEPSSMVGLVCPRCRTICRGTAELQACLASCGQKRPVQTVAPAMRGHRQPQHRPRPGQPHMVSRGRGGIRGGLTRPQPPQHKLLGRKPQESAQDRSQQPLPPQQRSQQPSQPQLRPQQPRAPQQKPQPGPSNVKSTAKEGRPNLQKIGQKLGLAVSITSVGEKAKKSSEEEQVVAEDQVKEESVNIKTEPDEVHEVPEPAASDDRDEDSEYMEPEPEADPGYEAQFDDGFDLGEDYVGAGDNYPGYDDYDESGADETSKN